jgi:hypothetical protein
MAICKGCGATIIWIETKNGKKMPCDAKQVKYWARSGAAEKIVVKSGDVVSAVLLPADPQEPETGVGYIPHWATCPVAGVFKRG